jgi:hypothetical protein
MRVSKSGLLLATPLVTNAVINKPVGRFEAENLLGRVGRKFSIPWIHKIKKQIEFLGMHLFGISYLLNTRHS